MLPACHNAKNVKRTGIVLIPLGKMPFLCILYQYISNYITEASGKIRCSLQLTFLENLCSLKEEIKKPN